MDLRGEKALLVAILERAILDYASESQPAGVSWATGKYLANNIRNIRAEAHEWIFMEESHEPYTFLWICELLELSPNITREAIENAKNYREINEVSSNAINRLTIESINRRLEYNYSSATGNEIYYW